MSSSLEKVAEASVSVFTRKGATGMFSKENVQAAWAFAMAKVAEQEAAKATAETKIENEYECTDCKCKETGRIPPAPAKKPTRDGADSSE